MTPIKYMPFLLSYPECGKLKVEKTAIEIFPSHRCTQPHNKSQMGSQTVKHQIMSSLRRSWEDESELGENILVNTRGEGENLRKGVKNTAHENNLLQEKWQINCNLPQRSKY